MDEAHNLIGEHEGELISRQYLRKPGNYLAFFSSFNYLQCVALQFGIRHPAIPIWEQIQGMDEDEQHEFLAHFTTTSEGIGFAVLGGSFAEGIDLTGKRLSGAFNAWVAPSQSGNERVKLRRTAWRVRATTTPICFQAYKKLCKPLGVIRTPSDEGVIYLMDDRFAHPGIRCLLPGWWKIERSRF